MISFKSYPIVSHYPENKITTIKLVLSYGLAFIIVIMVTAQLMTYEKFIPIIENYQLPYGLLGAKSFAAVLVIVEVLSLPFLLRMSLSPLFRLKSLMCLITTAALWFFLGIWLVTTEPASVGSGLLGSIADGILVSQLTLPFAIFLSFYTGVIVWFLRNDFRLTSKKGL